MRKLIFGFLMVFNFVKADNQAPTFLPIELTEEFYSNSDIYIEVEVADESSIVDIFLYYRFSKDESFTNVSMEKEMFYIAEIPAFEVKAGILEYYFFARDEFGNQSTWPEKGENAPENYLIHESHFSGASYGDITIDLINPIADETVEDASIIILSLFNPEETLDLNHIHLFMDDEDISESTFKSIDMITYVPKTPLKPGLHKVKVQLINDNRVYLSKEFKFTLAEINLSIAEQFDWRKEIKFKGNLSYNSDFDEFFGKDRPENRPIDSHKLNVSAKFTIGDFKVKTSALINTHLIDETARLALERNQPSNRLKFGIASPYIDFKYADFSTEFSEFSLKGTRIRGIYSRFKLGPWKTIIVSGNTKELIRSMTEENVDSTSWTLMIDSSTAVIDTSYINHTKGTASRKMRAFRTELDFSQYNVGVNALTSYDDLDEYDLEFDKLYDQYTFLGNAVVSSDFTLRLNNKKTQIKFETAVSLMNNLRGASIDSLSRDLELSESQQSNLNDLFSSIEEKVGFNINTDMIIGNSEGRGISIPLPLMDSLNAPSNIFKYLRKNLLKKGTYRILFKSPIEFEKNSFDIQAEYKRVPINFISLGNSSIQTDVQGLKSSLKGRLFDNNFSINLGYDNEHDNILGDTPEEKLKSTTTTSIISSAGFGITLPELPTLNYSIRIMNRKGLAVEDGIETISNRTVTHTIAPSYRFDNENNTNVSLGVNIMLMNYNDDSFNSNDSLSINANFTTASYTGSLGLRFDSPLSFNMGGGLSINTPEDSSIMSTQFFVLSSKLSYKFWEKTLSSFIGLNIVNGKKDADPNNDGEINNLKLTIKGGAQYKISKNMSIGLNVDLISLTDKVTPKNNFSELKGKLKFKFGF